jgi:predicted DCC family thiol-disulfide oxidoreductase YuxK
MVARLVYDDDCGFCTWCARVADRYTPVEPVGFAALDGDADADLRARLPERYEECAHLVVGRTVYSCGEAVEQALARAHPAVGLLFGLLRSVPGYSCLREDLYRWGADRRTLWGRVVSSSSLD